MVAISNFATNHEVEEEGGGGGGVNMCMIDHTCHA